MDVAIITVGDEILAGDVVNTNASWLASELTERGVAVRQISTLPDDLDLIADHVREFSDSYDAVIVTGGVGGTPDDITLDAIAAAFGRSLVVNDDARADVENTLEEIRERRPDIALDVEAEASIPEGSRPLINGEGISPGCVLENVFAFPGIPSEMKAMFEQVADEFEGNVYSRTAYTSQSESNITHILERVEVEFNVSVGCYPNPDGGPKRIKITTDDDDHLDPAYEWLTERLDVEDAPS